MRLTVAAYSHFGARGLKGVETYYLVNEAWRCGYLHKVVAVSKKYNRLPFDLNLIETLPGESHLIFGLMHIRNLVWAGFPARWCGEAVFDRYAASRLSTTSGDLILTPGMISTARRAKKLGYRTFLYAATPDPRYLDEQIRNERAVFGLADRREDKDRSWMVSRWADSLAFTDYILAVSEFCKETYAAKGFPEKRIAVIPLGVSLERFRQTPPPAGHHFTCLFVGHVNGTTGIVKGLQYLLQAWHELDLKNATLVICGKIGPEAAEIVRRFRGKLDNVEFTGPVTDPAEYFHKAAVFVLPSVAEGMAKVTIEAMAVGRPVIVTPNCGAVARDGIDGFYVGPRDVHALKEKIVYFYNNRDEVQRMGVNASQWAQSFSWERFSRGIVDAVLHAKTATECCVSHHESETAAVPPLGSPVA